MIHWILLLVILAIVLYKNTEGIPEGAPPGPTRLPVIGNLHLLGSDPVQALMRIAKNYSEVINLN